jgi:hypothetical protein
MTCGGDLAFESVAAKVEKHGCAGNMLLFLGVSALGALAAHALAVALWRVLPCTRAKPLPDFLVFPVPELLLASLLVLPLGMAAAVLLMQVGSVANQVLGVLGMSALLAYLALVGAVLLGVSARRELLGLRYVEHSAWQGSELRDHKTDTSQHCVTHAASMLESTVPGDGNAEAHSPGKADAERLLLRLAPRHAAGYWQRPNVEAQQELRRTYQSGWPSSYCRVAVNVRGASLENHRCSHSPIWTRAGGKRPTLRLISSLVRHKVSGMPLEDVQAKVGPGTRGVGMSGDQVCSLPPTPALCLHC